MYNNIYVISKDFSSEWRFKSLQSTLLNKLLKILLNIGRNYLSLLNKLLKIFLNIGRNYLSFL